jgi:DNA-binding IclR family transcriptional regulator
MSPYYGKNSAPEPDLVPDWLFGGNRKRRVLEALVRPDPPQGHTADELAGELGIGRSTVFETLRALRRLELLVEDGPRARLDVDGTALGRAIAQLIDAVEPYATKTIERPPRRRAMR